MYNITCTCTSNIIHHTCTCTYYRSSTITHVHIYIYTHVHESIIEYLAFLLLDPLDLVSDLSEQILSF